MGIRAVSAFPETNAPAAVDIVAVHGIFEDSPGTWIESHSKALWLRDIFPYRQLGARVLLYEYDRKGLISPSSSRSDRISSLAITFVEELCADRQCDNGRKRPVIFICHGFGGLLVKSALAYSSTCLSDNLRHLRALYISTHAIMFLGTPHHGMTKSALQILSHENKLPGSSQFTINLVQSDMLKDVEDSFVPLSRNFRLFNFWERRQTAIGNTSCYVVEELSAAPLAEDTERSGLDATHSGMVKFVDISDSGYRVIYAALERYILESQSAIKARWLHDRKHLALAVQAKVEALLDERNRLKRVDTDVATPIDGPQSVMYVKRTGTDLSSPGSRTDHFFAGAPSSLWTGRSDCIEEMTRSLGVIKWHDSKALPKIFVVNGLGGSGKTEMCKKFALEHKDHYWAVLWADATNALRLEGDFGQIGEEVGKGRSWRTAVHFLSKCAKAWLLVIDNADDRGLDLRRFLPAAGNGHIIITSRLKQSSDYGTVGHIQLRGMAPSEAIVLLLRTAYPAPGYSSLTEKERDMASTVASELGYLAKALVHAGMTVAKMFKTLEKYLNHYLGHRQKLLSTAIFRSAEETNIRATWEIPFQGLLDQTAREYKDAVDLMHLLAFVHFDRIPERLAYVAMLQGRTRDSSDHQTKRSGRRTDWLDISERVMQATTILVDYSLLDHDSENDFFFLHPVVHEWARERLKDRDQSIWLDTAMRVLADCVSPRLEASQSKFRNQLLRHIDSCLEIYKHKVSDTYTPRKLEHCLAFERFASVYAENGLWKQAKTLQSNAVAFREKTIGRFNEDTINAHQNLGEILWNLFDIKAAIEVQAVVLNRRWWLRPSLGWWIPQLVLKPEHVSYCLALSELTRSLWLAGKRDMSRYTGERAVGGLSKHLGREDPKTLDAMFNLGRTYLHLGRLQQSYDLIGWVHEKREHFFGPGHLDTLMAKNELGMVLCEQGTDFASAERLVNEVLQGRKEILGEEHAYTLWSVNDLSKVLCLKGEYERAVCILEDIVPVVERTLGDRHVGMSMTRGNLARAYVLCNRWKDAEEILSKVISDMAEDHPDAVTAKLGLAKVRLRTGQIAEAQDDLLSLIDGLPQDLSQNPQLEEARKLLEETTRMLEEKRTSSSLVAGDGPNIA